MLDIADELHRWCEQGRVFAVATVVATGGSAPRQPGAALAVDCDGTAIGSVSGGCVEGAVYELCQEALESGDSMLQRFGYSDEDAFAVGLTCGGVIDIFVQPVDPDRRPELAGALGAVAAGDAAAVARIVSGPAELLGEALVVAADGSYDGGFGDPELDATVRAETAAFLEVGRTGTVEIGNRLASADQEQSEGGAQRSGSFCGEALKLIIESSVPPPRMLVFGAIDFAAALVRAGKFLGYHVTVCDARPVFATKARFPEADEVVVDWPHRYLDSQVLDGRAALCVLTHDAKFDIPLLQRALKLPVGYVGAMGSRRTHLQRLDRLREVGVTELELARLHSPIGLDLGARTPEETALSIAAEIVAHRRGGSGQSLTRSGGPIHHDTAPAAGRVTSVA
ncbi:XdhC family protein [Streptomyces sp. RB6PN25]|uniref:XdhC family protein n=1 Tax=Streptomyces humicola TaxID=2953240 RepID=A0ABT1PZN0_9ACTN|nr:XdhC/CoxI family protein [Streptomyces humicola]MCQ4083126.1 XdhC family protein [Streptomyces humicola]